MIELQHNRLHVSFPEVHPKAKCSVEFQRTLRIPDDNQDYPLPAGLGGFTILPVDDFSVPPSWKQHGGVFFPMYQSEAMWINFRSHNEYPFAVKVAAGKISAVTGEAWHNDLSDEPQDYVVIPVQPWLDGFSISEDLVRQFVAMPLGDGVTAEEQISGEAEWGGLQIIFYPMKATEYRKRYEQPRAVESRAYYPLKPLYCQSPVREMGLAPGGRIQQEIAEDPFGLQVWDASVSSRCFVHLLNSKAYRQVTGEPPPTEPITAMQYKSAGIPWFDYYLDGPTLKGSGILADMDGIGSALAKKGKTLIGNKPIQIAETINLSGRARTIREGNF